MISRLAALRHGIGAVALVWALSLPSAIQAQAAAAADGTSAQTPPEPAPANAAQPSDASATSAEGATTGDIIVTGSRLATGFSSPTPVAVVGAARLEQRGASNIADALNEVPAFRATNTPASGELRPNAGYVGGRILDLRGLGSVRTLTLVDGKRFVPSTTEATVDTNMIPSILLERAEVVTGGASAQYGSDAVAGVANLILNRRLNGLKASAQYSLTELGDNQTFTAGIAGGANVTDALHVFVGVEYEDGKGIGDCQAREFCRTETLNFGRNPGVTSRPANNILPNIIPSTVPFNGVTVPPAAAYTGRDFPALRPIDGITFSAAGVPRRFQYGAISNNLYMQGGEGTGENIYFRDLYFVSPIERVAVAGGLDWQVTPDITASLSMNYGHLEAEYTTQAYRNAAITIRNDNPFIPRSADPTLDIPTILAASGLTSFQLGKGFIELGRTPTLTRDNVFRTVASLEGKLGADWSWDAYYQYGRNSFRSDIKNALVTTRINAALDATRNAAGQPVCRVNADAITTNDLPGCVAYNPFGQQASEAAKNYIRADAFQTNVTTEHVVAANLRGNLFDLPAGPVAVAVGGEYRNDKARGDTDALSKQLAFYAGNGSSISGRIEVTEGYGEAEIPLLHEMPFFEELSLNGAVRRTHYSRSGPQGNSTVNVTTYKYGGVWEPIDAIRFRATKSRDIRAPNIAELFGPVTLSSGIVSDPVKGQTVVSITGGSNPNLVPEKADTFTAGVVLKPQGGFLGRFRASVDYYDIKIEDAISTLGQQNILTRCFQGDAVSCGLITRDGSGFATSVVDSLQNVNRLITRGIDIEVNYRQPLGGLGNVDFRLLANYVKDFITVDAIGPTERAGQTGLRGGTPPGLPDWTLDGLVSWNYEAFTLNAHARYINKGFYNAAFIGAEQEGYNIALTNSSSTNKVPSRTYFDLLGQYKIETDESRQLTFYVGVDNLFNTTPPLNPGSHGTGNNILFNPALRTFKVGARISY